jgi:mannose-6-phosphate isomerase-like protein (cupin superfamily)
MTPQQGSTDPGDGTIHSTAASTFRSRGSWLTAAMSLQLHNYRTEHWVIVKGTARVTLDEKTMLLKEDQSILIRCGEKHQVENAGMNLLEIIEVQVGSYLAEDNIIQLEDRFGRV